MAEVVQEFQERLLPEYEQLKKFGICTDETIRECMKQRTGFQMRLTQSKKTVPDYLAYIIFETKVHRWISEKEKATGKRLVGLKMKIVNRITHLYRECLQLFPDDMRMWRSYIDFCKKSAQHEVLAVYERMLQYHGSDTQIWCQAASWVYEFNPRNVRKVKELFCRALQRHPAAADIHKAFFDIMLHEASKMNPEKNLAKNTTSEQELGLQRALVVYTNARKHVETVEFLLQCLTRCEEPQYRNLTGHLQKKMLHDLKEDFPLSALAWNKLAQRELNGFHTVDYMQLNTGKPKDPEEDPPLKAVYKPRSLKQRIEHCCTIYQLAQKALRTQEICTMFIDAMLDLNRDMSEAADLKRQCLATAFRTSHKRGQMSDAHYEIYTHMLVIMHSPTGTVNAEAVLKQAIARKKSAKLYEILLSVFITTQNEPKVAEIFKQARAAVGDDHPILWKPVIEFYKTCGETQREKLKALYTDVCPKKNEEFAKYRAEFLEFRVKYENLGAARKEYERLCVFVPTCIELHKTMIKLEKLHAGKNAGAVARIRAYQENACFYSGKKSINAWVDYMRFESEYGFPHRATLLYERAKHMLAPELVQAFIKEIALNF